MIDALTEDTQKTATGTVASASIMSSTTVSVSSQPTSTALSKEALEKAQADLETLQQEKEAEI